ncbi:MAG: hypothetical protein LBQ08_00320 [Holosporaceae bacterium]|nr:hypothetical protein [Holosporaceae bacterium]
MKTFKTLVMAIIVTTQFAVGAMLCKVVRNSSNITHLLTVPVLHSKWKDKLNQALQKGKALDTVDGLPLPMGIVVLKGGLIMFPGNGALAKILLETEKITVLPKE